MDKSSCTQERLYVTSNENLKQIFESFETPPKSVLTVGSSLDQFYNAIYYGAEMVTIADNSRYVPYFGELKNACFKNLEYDEFINFLYDVPGFITNNNDLYFKVFDDMNEDSKQFWSYDLNKDKTYLYNMIDLDVDLDSSRYYQDRESYKKLKKIIENRKFKKNYINADLTEFPNLVDEKYDLILLSNIDDYFIDKTDKEKIYTFIDAVKSLYKNNLNENGVIQITSSMNHNNIPKTNFYNSIKKEFAGGEFFTLKNSGLYSNYGSSNVSLFVKKSQKIFKKETNEENELQ